MLFLPGAIEAEACEGSSLPLTCAADEIMMILKSEYGTLSGLTCSDPTGQSKTCTENVLNEVSDECIGRGNCSFDVKFPHCKQTNNALRVVYKCLLGMLTLWFNPCADESCFSTFHRFNPLTYFFLFFYKLIKFHLLNILKIKLDINQQDFKLSTSIKFCQFCISLHRSLCSLFQPDTDGPRVSKRRQLSQQTRGLDPMMFKCWSSAVGGRSILKQQ